MVRVWKKWSTFSYPLMLMITVFMSSLINEYVCDIIWLCLSQTPGWLALMTIVLLALQFSRCMSVCLSACLYFFFSTNPPVDLIVLISVRSNFPLATNPSHSMAMLFLRQVVHLNLAIDRFKRALRVCSYDLYYILFYFAVSERWLMQL